MSLVKETLEAPKTSKPEAERRDQPMFRGSPRLSPGDGLAGSPRPAAWSQFASPPPWAAFAPPLRIQAAPTAAPAAERNAPARQGDGRTSEKSGCACGTPGATSDPCVGCQRVLAAASGTAAVPPPESPSDRSPGNGAGEMSDRFDSPLAAITTALFGREVPMSRPGDASEREADRIAASNQSEPARATIAPASSASRKESFAREVPLLSLGGEPLPAAVRSFYEPRFGVSLADVRVHTGATAARYTGALGAQAFTYGNHIWMGAGGGVHPSLLLAHEITHAVQQGTSGEWQIARKPDDAATKDDPDRNIPLGALDDERFDYIARAALGDVQWTVFREFVRGAAGGLLSTSPAQVTAILAKFRGMSLGETFDFIKGFGPGVVEGFWSSLKGLFEAIFTLIKLPFEIQRFLIETLPQLAVKFGERLAKLATEGDGIGAELRTALNQFLANPAAAARQLDALMAHLKDFALSKVRGLGRGAAEKLISFLAEPPREFGHDIGMLTGMVLFEVLLAVGTSGIGNVVAKAASVAGRVASRAFVSVVEMLSSVRSVLTSVLDAVSKLGGRLTGKLGDLLERLMGILRRLLGELGEMLAAPGVTAEGVRVPIPKGPTIVESRAVKPPGGGGRAGAKPVGAANEPRAVLEPKAVPEQPKAPPTRPEQRDFTGDLRGERVTLPGVRTQRISYTKRDPGVAAKLRAEFNSTGRKEFLQDLANNPAKVGRLKQSGLSDAQIRMMRNGEVPRDYQVHHKLPLDDGGTNAGSNLVLVEAEPFHRVLTNAQNSLTRGMQAGETRVFDFPIPDGFVYP